MNRNFKDILHSGHGESGRRVARYDDHFGALGQEETTDLDAVALDGFSTFASVGHASSVSDVKNIFCREEVLKCGDHSESADTRIKNSDGIQRAISWHWLWVVGLWPRVRPVAGRCVEPPR